MFKRAVKEDDGFIPMSTNMIKWYKRLLEYEDDFQSFFILVSEAKVQSNRDELVELRDIVDTFRFSFDVSAIIYLKDTITCEMTLPCKSRTNRTRKKCKRELRIKREERDMNDF